MQTTVGKVVLIGNFSHPLLEYPDDQNEIRNIPFELDSNEGHWVATLDLTRAKWKFRIRFRNMRLCKPADAAFFTTTQSTVWVQDGEIFLYPPKRKLSNSKVIKLDTFEGLLSPRPLYIYLPRGYAEHTDKLYAVLYMQDGQNCFEAFAHDSYVGSWKADLVADRLIKNGETQEFIIVGVGHGGSQRIAEYLPHFSTFAPDPTDEDEKDHALVEGKADLTARYYIEQVAPYIESQYRVITDRQARALCGSSMGGLFTLYVALFYPYFAKHFAALSTSFWITKGDDGTPEMIDRLRLGSFADVRIWLDSGTFASHGVGNDGQAATAEAKAALLEAGMTIGEDFQHFVDVGASHSEGAWSARLDKIFRFLFPVNK